MGGYSYFHCANKINIIYHYVNKKGTLSMVKHLQLRVCFTENHTKLLLFEGLMLICKTNMSESHP